MSNECLKLSKEDAKLMIAAHCHIGDKNVNFLMKQYVHDTNGNGNNIFQIEKIWQKLLLAARAIAAIETPQDVACVAMRPQSQRACLKFGRYTSAFPFAGRFTPGTFTNQIQRAFREPRLLICHDPRSDHQAILEASYVNIPVIAFCDADCTTRYVDIVIPCNNKNPHSIGLMWWLLTREVMRMRGSISRDVPWDVMVDLFFYRDPEDIEREEIEADKTHNQQITGLAAAPGFDATAENWNDAGWDTDPMAVPVSGDGGFNNAPFGAIGNQGAPQNIPPVRAAPTTAVNADWSTIGNNDEWGADQGWH